MVIRSAAVALVLVAACGGRSAPVTAPAAAEAEPAPAPVAAPPDDSPLTEAECGALIDHVVDVGIEQQRRTKKPEEVPTAEQVAQIRDEMRTAMTPECLKLDRAAFRCAMAAATDAELAVCEEQQAK
jgi:hypothetical protein